jgi:hypothetical protein
LVFVILLSRLQDTELFPAREFESDDDGDGWL